jgi:hypothetical protein
MFDFVRAQEDFFLFLDHRAPYVGAEYGPDTNQ